MVRYDGLVVVVQVCNLSAKRWFTSQRSRHLVFSPGCASYASTTGGRKEEHFIPSALKKVGIFKVK